MFNNYPNQERPPATFNSVERPAYHDLEGKLRQRPIEILPIKLPVTHENLRERFPEGPMVVCDIYVAGIEAGEAVVGGFETEDGILNIDHHAPDPRMCRFVSSTPLAIERVRAAGLPSTETPVITNHLDCDAILSSAIMRGILEPEDRFAEAAIAADHTGQENAIADLLQALQHDAQEGEGMAYSLRNLERLLNGQELEPSAQEALAQRLADRQALQELVERGEIESIGQVSLYVSEGNIDAGLLPALLPDAAMILVAFPRKGSDGQADGGWNISLRLGKAGAGKFTIQDLDIASFDPNYGGRWNAGGDKRQGGTNLSPEEYARRLDGMIEGYLAQK